MVSFLHWYSHIDRILGIEWISVINEKISVECREKVDALPCGGSWDVFSLKISAFMLISSINFYLSETTKNQITNISLKLRINVPVYLKQRILQLSSMRRDLSVHIQPSEVLELLVCREESVNCIFIFHFKINFKNLYILQKLTF